MKLEITNQDIYNSLRRRETFLPESSGGEDRESLGSPRIREAWNFRMSTHRQISLHTPANLFKRTGKSPSTHRQISLHAPANLPPHTGKSLSTPANRLARLNDEFVRNGFEEGGLVVLGPDDVGWSWAYGLPLEVGHGGSVLLALASGRVVAFHAVQEILSAAGMPDVFGSDANLFLLDPVPHGFRDDDAQGSVRHVEHAARAPVVVLVGHAGVDRSVGFDVDDVADLVDLKQRRHGRHSVLAERTAEHVPGSAPISLGIRHFY